jgi:membrane dipeptidase
MRFFLVLLFVFSTSCGIAQDYKKIHRNAIVVDTHNDLLGAVIMRGLHLEDDLSMKAHSDFRRFKEGGVDVQVFSVFCNETFGKDTAFKFANIEIDSLYAIATRNGDKLEIVRTPLELLRVVKKAKMAGLIGVEGGHMIEDSIAYLDHLYQRGARYLTLTWNNSTSWATSARDESDSVLKRSKGLSDFGRRIVRHMNELGMMIDVSHVGEQTLADVLAITTKPVLASHSSVYAISPQFRNLKDGQIKAIAKNGGVIQVNFAAGFLDSSFANFVPTYFARHKTEADSLVKLKWSSPAIGLYMKRNYPKEILAILPPLSAVLDHIDYIVKLVGVDFVGLGSDFDGIPYPPVGLEDVSKYPGITEGLVKRGYRKKDIQKILGGNFLRVFKANAQK